MTKLCAFNFSAYNSEQYNVLFNKLNKENTQNSEKYEYYEFQNKIYE